MNNYLLLIVLGGGLSSFLRTTMLNRAQDGIASSLRSQLFRSLLLDREMEWYHLEQEHDHDHDHEQAEDQKQGAKDSDKGKSNERDGSGDNINAKTNTKESNIKESNKKDKNKKASAASTTTSHSSHSPSAIQSVLTKDVDTVSSTITTTLANTFRSTCSIIFATKNMYDINSNLLSVSLSIVPIIGSAAVVLNKFVKKITLKYHTIIQQSEIFVTERIDHISTVKTSNREQDEIDQYTKMQSTGLQLSRRASLAKGLFMGFMFSSSSSALVCLFHIGGKSVASGKMTFGELKTFAAYTFMLGLGTSGLMKGVGQIIQGLVCAERIYDLMNDNHDNQNENDCDNKTNNDENKGKDSVAASTTKITTTSTAVVNTSVTAISLSKVNFAYASDTSKSILKNISMSIQRGQVVALAGANGSGKSTLASLLVALYKPQSGNVTVTIKDSEKEQEKENEIDFMLLDRKTQSSLVQLVPQQPVMFDMSIRENVTYTNPDAKEEDIQKALKASNCDTFISKLKGGLEYNVGRNGCKLSGGQRQRLALARALLCDPALLILDEPNSSMDAEGDNAVADAVQNCRDGDSDSGVDGNDNGDIDKTSSKKKRGLLLITHKATSLELADVIFVLKDGEIVEQGTYNELVGNKESALCQLMPDLQ